VHGANGGDGVLSSVLNRDLAKHEGMTLTQIGKAMGRIRATPSSIWSSPIMARAR
jgi:hypothetical protein